MNITIPSPRRRGLGPCGGRALAAASILGTEPTALVAGATAAQRQAVADYRAETEGLERFELFDEGVLEEAAAEARGQGLDRRAAVDSLVRSLTDQVKQWDRALTRLGRRLQEQTPVGLPQWARAFGQAESTALWEARRLLLNAVITYHHGSAPELGEDGPWWQIEASSSAAAARRDLAAPDPALDGDPRA